LFAEKVGAANGTLSGFNTGASTLNAFPSVIAAIISFVLASSHSEAPNTVSQPQADGTDLYVFRAYETGRSNYVVILANFLPLQSPFGGPNYFSLSDQHVYEILIDNTGDGVEDITFQFVYGNRLGGNVNTTTVSLQGICDDTPIVSTQSLNTGIALNINGRSVPIALKYAGPVTAGNTQNLNWFEFYSINYIVGPRSNTSRSVVQTGSSNTVFTKPFDNVGTKTFPDYATYANQYIYNITIPDCSVSGRVFLGQRQESFQINLGGIFDLVNFVPIPGFPGAIPSNPNNNALREKNISTFALEVPIQCVTGTGNGVIGVWQSTRQFSDSCPTHVIVKQVQRMAMPLTNELMMGLIDKGAYNRQNPVNDNTLVLPYIQYPTFPQILSNLFLATVNQQLNASLTTIAPNNFPRTDLVYIFMTGIPGINQLKNITNADMVRLNTSTPVTAPASQKSLGVIAGDGAGFPNGRRPGDDTVDVGLDVLMGALCWLNVSCNPTNAPVGNVLFTDGVPTSVFDYDLTFPYFKVPLPGYTGATVSPVATFTPIITFCPSSASNWSMSYVLPLTLFIMLASMIMFAASR